MDLNGQNSNSQIHMDTNDKKVPKIWFGVDLICQKETLNGSKLDQNIKNRMDG